MVSRPVIMNGYDSAERVDCKYIVLSVSKIGRKLNYEFVENLVFESPEDAISYYTDLEKDFPSEEAESYCLFKVYADIIIKMSNGKVEIDAF